MERKLAFVFAGCGGTFWTATPVLAAMIRKYDPDLCLFVDPDTLEPRNLQRQWVTAEGDENKTTLAMDHTKPSEYEGRWFGRASEFPGEHTPEELNGHDVIVVTNVDNNAARLAIREWCAKRAGFVAMIVSGCDRYFGQVYSGAWIDESPIHDWLPSHPDVVARPRPDAACGQNILSNSTTGTFLGWSLDRMVKFYRAGENERNEMDFHEYYWKSDAETGTLKMWTDEVPQSGLVKEGAA